MKKIFVFLFSAIALVGVITFLGFDATEVSAGTTLVTAIELPTISFDSCVHSYYTKAKNPKDESNFCEGPTYSHGSRYYQVCKKCGHVNTALYYTYNDVLEPIYGDANDDGEVDDLDMLLMIKYWANYDFDTGTSTVEVEEHCADVNVDGEVDDLDMLMLIQYWANYDFDTGTSTVELGCG